MNKRIDLIIADDHKMITDGLKSIFAGYKNIQVVDVCQNGKELLERLKYNNADVLLLDIEMPEMDGAEVLKVIPHLYPSLRIIIISMHGGEMLVEDFFKKGAHGFIPKSSDIDFLITAIEEVMEKGNCFELSIRLAQEKTTHSRLPLNPHNLSSREIEVLTLTCKGKANKEIASELHIVERTVELHKTNIYKKTNLKKVADLVLYGVKHGLC